jgi:predicted flap endonuclease-1-like 5' DNA nuclease
VEQEPEAAEPEDEGEEQAEPETEDVKPDDLKKLEGIGPKISSVLQASGILTYAQLSNADVDTLKQILEDEDPRLLRLADPTSWPDQAALAASGEWDALKALQQELKGGRKN